MYMSKLLIDELSECVRAGLCEKLYVQVYIQDFDYACVTEDALLFTTLNV